VSDTSNWNRKRNVSKQEEVAIPWFERTVSDDAAGCRRLGQIGNMLKRSRQEAIQNGARLTLTPKDPATLVNSGSGAGSEVTKWVADSGWSRVAPVGPAASLAHLAIPQPCLNCRTQSDTRTAIVAISVKQPPNNLRQVLKRKPCLQSFWRAVRIDLESDFARFQTSSRAAKKTYVV
jgi:hypothetical protein